MHSVQFSRRNRHATTSRVVSIAGRTAIASLVLVGVWANAAVAGEPSQASRPAWRSSVDPSGYSDLDAVLNKTREQAETELADEADRDRLRAIQLVDVVERLRSNHLDDGTLQRQALSELAGLYRQLGQEYARLQSLEQLAEHSRDDPEQMLAVARRVMEESTSEVYDWKRLELAAGIVRQISRDDATAVGSEFAAQIALEQVTVAMQSNKLFEAWLNLQDLTDAASESVRDLLAVELLARAGYSALARDAREQLAMQPDGNDDPDAAEAISRLGDLLTGEDAAWRPPMVRVEAVERPDWMAQGQMQEMAIAEIASALVDAAEEGSLHAQANRTYIGSWLDMVGAIPDQRPELRQHVSEHDAADVPSSADEVMSRLRRNPYSADVHDALLAAGEASLRRDRGGLAVRHFEDVLAYSEDDAMRRRAERGLELASEAVAVTAEVRETDGPTAVLQTPLRSILPHAGRDALSSDVAGHVARGSVSMSETGNGWVIAATPMWLAGYRPGEAQPAWSWSYSLDDLTPSPQADEETAPTVVPASISPAVGRDVVVMPVGMDERRQTLSSLKAFDLETGEPRWSVSGASAWEGVHPAGTPAIADGRVYSLVVEPGLLPSVSLVCLDEQTGELLWRRELVRHDYPVYRLPPRGSQQERLDLGQFGGGVTIHRGAVYCNTSVGVVARVDARDGLIEWVHSYEQAGATNISTQLLARQGGPPVVDGHGVWVAPRDTTGVLALDATSGAVVWRHHYLPGERLIGLTEDEQRLIVADATHLVAVDPRDGAVRWHTRWPTDAVEVSGIGNDRVIARLADGTLWGGDLAEGRLSPVTDMPTSAGDVTGLLWHDRLVLTSAEPAHQLADDASDRVEGLHQPTLMRIKPTGDMSTSMVVHASGQLRGYVTNDADRPAWARLTPPGVRRKMQVGATLVLVYPALLLAVDLTDGSTRWQRPLPRPAANVSPVEGDLVVVHHLGMWGMEGMASRIDMQSGRLLWQMPVRHGTAALPDVPPIRMLRAIDDLPAISLLALDMRPGQDTRRNALLRLDPDYGIVIDHAYFDLEDVAFPGAPRMVGDWLVAMTNGSRIQSARIAGNELRDFAQARLEGIEDGFRHGPLQMSDFESRWLLLRQTSAHHPGLAREWVLRLDELELRARGDTTAGTIMGDHWYRIDLQQTLNFEPSLEAVDLTRDEHVQQWRWPDDLAVIPRAVLCVRQTDGRLMVLSGCSPRGDRLGRGDRWTEWPSVLRFDVWDVESGEHIAGRALEDLHWYRGLEAQWLGDRLYITQETHLRSYLLSDLAL